MTDGYIFTIKTINMSYEHLSKGQYKIEDVPWRQMEIICTTADGYPIYKGVTINCWVVDPENQNLYYRSRYEWNTIPELNVPGKFIYLYKENIPAIAGHFIVLENAELQPKALYDLIAPAKTSWKDISFDLIIKLVIGAIAFWFLWLIIDTIFRYI